MIPKIKEIEIERFRGIPLPLKLDLKKKNLLIKGDNGTGKSSIVDAIEFFYTGDVSRLRGVKGITLKRHAHHVNYKPEDKKIIIKFTGDISLEKTHSNDLSQQDKLQEYFKVAKERRFILHREGLIDFITSAPADKYRAIASIIGIEHLDEIELEMMRLFEKFKKKVGMLEDSFDKNITDLSRIIGQNISNLDQIIIAINQKLKENDLPELDSIENVEKYSEEKFKNVIKKGESSKKITNIKSVIKEIENFPQKGINIEDLKRINELKIHLLEENIKSKTRLKKFLIEGKEVITLENKNICPLCNQEIIIEDLIESIDKRLKDLELSSKEASQLRELSYPIISNLSLKHNDLISIKSDIEKIDDLKQFREDLNKNTALINDLKNSIEEYENFEKQIPIKDYDQIFDKIKKFLERLLRECKKISENFQLSEKENKIYEIISLLNQVKTKREDIIKIKSDLQTNNRYYDFAEKIYYAFSDVKKEKIDRIYEELKNDIQNFYQKLHPNDQHRNIDLSMDQAKRASTLLKIDSFNRKGEDPRALISEGHLDSLGVCIFLAFVKKFNQDFPLIILDDIVSTIDANHREYLSKLLLEEFNEYQLIITTHDEIWFEQLCANQKIYSAESNFLNLKIIDWDLDNGPRILRYRPQWERILDKLNSGDKDTAGMESRLYLEWILKEICERMRGKVEYRREGKYMVNELLDAAQKRIEDLIKRIIDNDYFKNKVQNSFTTLRGCQFMANLLSHDNEANKLLSMGEVKSFCNTVNELYNAFLCSKCGYFITYERESKDIRCLNPRCEIPDLIKLK